MRWSNQHHQQRSNENPQFRRRRRVLADFEAALECFDRAVATDRNNAHAWHNRAYALDHLGRGDEAESSRSFAAAIASPFAEGRGGA